ncbi:hypothetical protein PAMC26577_31595 [Caballeronia sordidicola]|uniref:Uncharacterized protein n=1 Tax=Caballeronia sordidicola TaxID=196367 RepID=A0A242MEI1_CABSO|nr:hypothetical protein PAMC26577_31595 [Caballeronia sordidicola]
MSRFKLPDEPQGVVPNCVSRCAKAAGAAPGGAFGANLTGFPLRRAA